MNEERRLVVCKNNNVQIMEKSSKECLPEQTKSTVNNSTRSKNRRPDMQFYIPRARRKSSEMLAENIGIASTTSSITTAITTTASSTTSITTTTTDVKKKNKIRKKKKTGLGKVNPKTDEETHSIVIRQDGEICQNLNNSSEIVKVEENKHEDNELDETVKEKSDISNENVKGFKNLTLNKDKLHDQEHEGNKSCGNVETEDKLNENTNSEREVNANETEEVKFNESKQEDDNLRKSDTVVKNATNKYEISSNQNVEPSDKNKDDEETENSWEALYNEDGECLMPHIIKELTDSLGDVTIQKPKIDYTKFQPVVNDSVLSEYGHIIEIYDFPTEFKTQDLLLAFAQYRERGFDIKWIDDTHALGLFSSPMAAADALTMRHPMMKTRSLSEASPESKLKARRCGEFLQPYKPRPQTSASLARRLVTGALGLRVKIPKEQQEKERQKLKEAKAMKKLAAKQKSDAWEGVIG